jgi:hypothetical protein
MVMPNPTMQQLSDSKVLSIGVSQSINAVLFAPFRASVLKPDFDLAFAHAKRV